VGDIDLDVLPFFGEQPTRDAPGPDAAIRNWGNCYRFNTEDFSAIVLVDSGADPLGSMVDVVRSSVESRGPVDVVLSCLREFESPFFGGLTMEWATLPFARLQQLHAQLTSRSLPSTTAGAEGTAELCEAAGARYYLPYANGFSGPGAPISDVGWGAGEPSEAALVTKVSASLARRKAKTAARNWNPGDSVSLGRRALRLRRHG
jgi:hypothetical protein